MAKKGLDAYDKVLVVIGVSCLLSIAISWFVVLDGDERDSLVRIIKTKIHL